MQNIVDIGLIRHACACRFAFELFEYMICDSDMNIFSCHCVASCFLKIGFVDFKLYRIVDVISKNIISFLYWRFHVQFEVKKFYFFIYLIICCHFHFVKIKLFIFSIWDYCLEDNCFFVFNKIRHYMRVII